MKSFEGSSDSCRRGAGLRFCTREYSPSMTCPFNSYCRRGLAELVRKSDTGVPAPTAERGVHYPESRGRIQVPVFERDSLTDGDEIAGPAIIEEDYTNTVIAPGQSCRVVSAGNLLIDIAGAETAPAVALTWKHLLSKCYGTRTITSAATWQRS